MSLIIFSGRTLVGPQAVFSEFNYQVSKTYSHCRKGFADVFLWLNMELMYITIIIYHH